MTAEMIEQRVIDACVFHDWGAQADVKEYLPRAWQEYIGSGRNLPRGAGEKPIALGGLYSDPRGCARRDGTDGAEAYSDPAVAAREALAEPGVTDAVLQFGKSRLLGAEKNPQFAVAMARAFNDWSLDRWLDGTVDGLWGSLIVPSQVPEEAAREIHRHGDHPRLVQVTLCGNGLDRPFGHPAYAPIFEAAAAHGLAVAIHAGGEAVPEALAHPSAGGLPFSHAEHQVLAAQPLMTHVVSLVGQGVFERHPGLRVLIAGGGITWVPSLMWRMNVNFTAFGRDTPWLKRTPIEYFRDHIRVTTWPLETAMEPDSAQRLFAAYPDLRHALCYAAGRPANDAQPMATVSSVLPEDWRGDVFGGNAAELYAGRLAPAAV